ncbi:response regulator [Arthrobacter silvisoli]|uniref:response regulator n=1 Tax=Arthrobacter silvisoli TaxID=2291022 RepID=UPI000E219BFE|nr:response regulator transcription factor [Arthrobacter silvisoli]
MDAQVRDSNEASLPVLPARIFILSGHGMLRQGLRELCEVHGLEVAGEGASAEEARRLIPGLEPSVAVIEDIVRDSTGIEVCRDLRTAAPRVHCLLLTGWDEEHAARAAVLAGASGYVGKELGNTAGLIEKIRAAAAGHPLMEPELRQRVAENLRLVSSAPWLKSMTRQERTILSSMAQGLTNEQIGRDLYLPAAEVDTRVSSVLQKLGFRPHRKLQPAMRTGRSLTLWR